TQRIETILRERVFQSTKRYKKVANAFKTLAKYPPAFGLMGTVLGLVNLMLTITKGVDAKEAGLEMAVALVATLYGLILSNLVLNPAGEYVMKEAQGEEEFGEVALQAILLLSQRTSLLESQELLNSFVGDQHQVDLLAEWSQTGQEAEAA
ncbi:MAG: MotA/TolQ/ExbB proton channel family protein, partial [Bdellovibrionales bacterium]|nr:MotA/TolQ/ExbB proton channel family protein [Bdellovibrionales bacterium]